MQQRCDGGFHNCQIVVIHLLVNVRSQWVGDDKLVNVVGTVEPVKNMHYPGEGGSLNWVITNHLLPDVDDGPVL